MRTHHGDAFEDNYEWLRDKESAEVVDLLKAENAYQEAVTAHQEPLREAIFQEIKGRTQETDLSVPNRKDGWWYYTRSVEGKEYGIHCRVRGQDTGDRVADWTPPAVEAGVVIPGEEVLLDGNLEAEGKPFFAVGGAATTIDGTLYAYAVDNAGDERFTLRIKDLRTGDLLPDVIENVFYGISFSPDGSRIFYTVVDDSWRPYQVKSHVLGTPVSEDEVIYQEDDVAMWLGFELSADRRHLVLSIGCSEFSETRLLRFDDPDAGLRTVISRDERILYEAEPFLLPDASGRGQERILLTHNKDAINSMVSLVDPAELAKPLAEQHWSTVVAHSDQVRVNGAGVTSTHAVVSVRKDTIERVQVLPLAGLGTPEQGAAVEPAFDEELYTAGVAGSDYEAPVIRMGYTSYFTPSRVYDFVLPTPELPAGELLLRKESPVLGGYTPSDYVATREWAVAVRRDPDSALGPPPRLRPAGFDGGRPGVRLRLLRDEHGSGLRDPPAVPAGPRHRVRDRAHPRRRRAGPALVRRRQEAAQEEHLHRLHRGHGLARRIRLGGPGTGSRRWAAPPAAC